LVLDGAQLVVITSEGVRALRFLPRPALVIVIVVFAACRMLGSFVDEGLGRDWRPGASQSGFRPPTWPWRGAGR
jgi:hypothetical protein